MCFQCSGLNKKFNPKEDAQERLMRLGLFRKRESLDRDKLFKMRTDLVKGINPLENNGTDLHEVFFELGRVVNSKKA